MGKLNGATEDAKARAFANSFANRAVKMSKAFIELTERSAIQTDFINVLLDKMPEDIILELKNDGLLPDNVILDSEGK